MAPDFEKFMVFGVQIYPLAAYYAKAQIKCVEVMYLGTDQDRLHVFCNNIMKIFQKKNPINA